MTHYIKIAPKYFGDIASGAKPFECRRHDRDYRVGDTLVLREWLPGVEYTGREIIREITYILPGGMFGIMDRYCVLGISPSGAINKTKENT